MGRFPECNADCKLWRSCARWDKKAKGSLKAYCLPDLWGYGYRKRKKYSKSDS